MRILILVLQKLPSAVDADRFFRKLHDSQLGVLEVLAFGIQLGARAQKQACRATPQAPLARNLLVRLLELKDLPVRGVLDVESNAVAVGVLH